MTLITLEETTSWLRTVPCWKKFFIFNHPTTFYEERPFFGVPFRFLERNNLQSRVFPHKRPVILSPKPFVRYKDNVGQRPDVDGVTPVRLGGTRDVFPRTTDTLHLPESLLRRGGIHTNLVHWRDLNKGVKILLLHL